MDARDRRLGQAIQRAQHVCQRVRVGQIIRVAVARHLLHPIQIRAGTKALARAGENDRAYAFVAIERDEGVGQLGNQRIVECIVEIRPIQHDDRDRVAHRDVEQGRFSWS